MKTMLAIDQGTTSSRAILFDEAGQTVAMAQREFRQIFPQPGWVEHDAREIWSSQLAVTREVWSKRPPALANASQGAMNSVANGESVDLALGITNQRETTVLWDRRTGEPLANAIVWQDRRTAAACATLAGRGLTDKVRELIP